MTPLISCVDARLLRRLLNMRKLQRQIYGNLQSILHARVYTCTRGMSARLQYTEFELLRTFYRY